MSNIVQFIDYFKETPFYERFVKTVRPIEKYEYEETDWVVDMFLARGHVTLLTGGPGTAKTTFATALAAKLTSGAAGSIKRNIVYFGPEVNIGQQILGNYQSKHGSMKERLWATDMEGDLVKLAHEMDKVIKHVGAEVIIVDTLITFSGDYDTNNASDIRKLLLPLRIAARKLNVAVLILGHNKKGANNGSWEDAAGSHQISAQVSIQCSIFRPDDTNRDKLTLRIFKSNIGPDWKEMRLEKHEIDENDWKKGISIRTPDGWQFIDPIVDQP